MKKSGFQNSKSKIQNQKTKLVRDYKLQNSDHKTRTDNQRLPAEQSKNVIFGVLPVLEALRAETRRVDKIYVAEGVREKRLSEILHLARLHGVPFQKIARESFAKYVESGSNHQGVIAFVASADYYPAERLLEEIYCKTEANEAPFILILDGVEDPRNLGAILRSAECAGVDGVFIPERRAVGLTDTVAKSSAGAAEYVKIAKVTNINRLIDELKEHNIWVVGTNGEAENVYTAWDWSIPCALILGGEGKGLHRLTREKCDALVKIPMRGRIESLNVSVAAGVILFEAIRQRVQNSKLETSI